MKHPGCPLCGGQGEHFGDVGPIPVSQCTDGHLPILLTWPWGSVEAYEAHYEGADYHRTACERQGLPWQENRHLEHLSACRQRIGAIKWRWMDLGLNARMIDVGTGNAAMVRAGIEAGFVAFGIEPSAHMRKWAEDNLGLAIRAGDWTDATGTWDLVTCCDVIEHMVDPRLFLVETAMWTPRLYVETPEWDGNLAGKHVKPFEHPTLFSSGAITEMAELAGWTVRLTRPIPGKLALFLER